MQTSSLQHSYNIKNNALYFYAGRLENGNQVLMGLQLPDIVMIVFDTGGNYLNTFVREVSLESNTHPHNPSESEENEILIELHGWQMEVGFTNATISVKKFFLTDRWIGIQDLPNHYQEVLDHPEDYNIERRRELQEDIRLWNERGDFVLYWDEDYYLNQDGELESS